MIDIIFVGYFTIKYYEMNNINKRYYYLYNKLYTTTMTISLLKYF